MSSYNTATIVGHLGQDPELRYSGDGTAFATLSVATSEQWKDKQTGEKKERTDWIRVKCSGRLAEVCGEYLKKGSLALFAGSIRVDEYEKDGSKRFDTYVRADTMKMLGGKPEGQRQERGGGHGAPRDRPARAEAPTQRDDFDSESIPF